VPPPPASFYAFSVGDFVVVVVVVANVKPYVACNDQCVVFFASVVFFLYFQFCEGGNQRRLRGQAHTTSRGEIQPARRELFTMILLIITLITQNRELLAPCRWQASRLEGGETSVDNSLVELIFNITQPS